MYHQEEVELDLFQRPLIKILKENRHQEKSKPSAHLADVPSQTESIHENATPPPCNWSTAGRRQPRHAAAVQQEAEQRPPMWSMSLPLCMSLNSRPSQLSPRIRRWLPMVTFSTAESMHALDMMTPWKNTLSPPYRTLPIGISDPFRPQRTDASQDAPGAQGDSGT
jgi:hypothetical protein